MTNDIANTSFEQATLPFGTALDAESTGATNQRFTIYDRSSVTGIDYAVNRSYSAGQGRFTSVDPIGMSATNIGNPQSMNLYAYTQNNPIDFVDPNGLNLRFYDVSQGLGCVLMGDGKFHCTEYINRYWYDDGSGGGGGNRNPDVESSGGGGGENNEQDKTDCEFLASVADTLAKLVHPHTFQRALSNFFVDWVNKDPSKRESRYNQFRSSGFRDEFKDEIGPGNSPNQVYHYVGMFKAGFVAALFLGNRYLAYAAAIRVANEHETEYEEVLAGDGQMVPYPKPPTPSHAADMRLNEVAVWHGAQVGAGTVKPSEVGNLIRKEVCKSNGEK